MFNKNLKKIRIQSGLSQRYVADYLKITPQSVSKWEKGDALPSIEYLPQLAECFDCTIDDFFAKECLKQEETKVLTSYFEISIQDNRLEQIKDFIRSNSSAINTILNFCFSLKGHKRLNSRFIENCLVCSKDDAELVIKGLEKWGMIAHIERGQYIVLEDDIDGHKMFLSLVEEAIKLEKI